MSKKSNRKSCLRGNVHRSERIELLSTTDVSGVLHYKEGKRKRQSRVRLF